MKINLIHGDSLEILKSMPGNSIDAVVTDPPYGLGFMGNKWDYEVPSVELWREVYRVLKHGGHLLSFAGTRTQHRMCVNIEDAGFEIRDMLAWLYGSGFPKNQAQLKPAIEPITLARKLLKKGYSLKKSIADIGLGGLNIERCRCGDEKLLNSFSYSSSYGVVRGVKTRAELPKKYAVGRYPANLIHDGGDAISQVMDIEKQKYFYIAKPTTKERDLGCTGEKTNMCSDLLAMSKDKETHGNPRKNYHPTVKPIALMRHLVALITPPNGIVLDPFCGSGTTGIGCALEGVSEFIGIDLDAEYLEIARQRITHHLNNGQLPLCI